MVSRVLGRYLRSIIDTVIPPYLQERVVRIACFGMGLLIISLQGAFQNLSIDPEA